MKSGVSGFLKFYYFLLSEGWEWSGFNKYTCMFIFLSCQTLKINFVLWIQIISLKIMSFSLEKYKDMQLKESTMRINIESFYHARVT